MRSPIIFPILFLLCLFSRAQTLHVISGSVADGKNAPLQGATIFLTGRMNITTSDVNGNFRLNDLSAGNYSIVITMVGYKPAVRNVAVYDQDIKLSLQLEQQATELKAVIVKPDRSRVKNLEVFKRAFLGESENAAQCKILNSEILTFNYNKKAGELIASTDDILTIKNQALGYQIKYVLLDFKYDESKNAVTYEGYPSFEELRGTTEEEAQWKRNRRIAFLGSIHQFIRAVYDENCRANGFIVYKIRNRPPFDLPAINKNWIKIDFGQVSFDSLLTVKDEHSKILRFSDALYVIYTKAKEQVEYQNKNYSMHGAYTDRWMPEGQVSIVNLFGPVAIEENGLFTPPANLYFEGYMGWEKIADLVPYEYSLAEPN